jgi:hypothetical protein
MAEGSELVLEVAEFSWLNVEVCFVSLAHWK